MNAVNKRRRPASRGETFPAPSAMLGNVFITWNILHYSRVLRQNSWTPQGRSFDDDTRAQLLRRPGRPAPERAGGNQNELPEYGDSGMSVMEMSHRSPAYQAIIDDAEATLRRIMGIPSNYRVLFFGRAAPPCSSPASPSTSCEAAARQAVGHAATSRKRLGREALRMGDARVLASSEDTHFDRIPDSTPLSGRVRTITWITSTFARTTPSLARSSTRFPTAAILRWWQTSQVAFCRFPSTWSATALSTPARRKTRVPRV